MSLARRLVTCQHLPKLPKPCETPCEPSPVQLLNLKSLTVDCPSKSFRSPFAFQCLSSLRISKGSDMYTLSAAGDGIAITADCYLNDFAETWEDLTGYAKPIIRLYDGLEHIDHRCNYDSTLVLLTNPQSRNTTNALRLTNDLVNGRSHLIICTLIFYGIRWMEWTQIPSTCNSPRCMKLRTRVIQTGILSILLVSEIVFLIDVLLVYQYFQFKTGGISIPSTPTARSNGCNICSWRNFKGLV